MPTSPLPSPLLVRQAGTGDRPVLEHLWQMFKHDMSQFVTNSLPRPDGTFKADRLAAALEEPGNAAFLLLAGDRPVGFATVAGTGSALRKLSSFFVVRGARGAGVGFRAACEVMRRYPGSWEIGFQDANATATRLWPRVAAELANGTWTQEHRPVPGKPDVPPDHFILFTMP